MIDRTTLSIAAVSVAEIARDMLGAAANDAGHLANDAMALVGHILLDSDPVGRAITLGASAIALEQRLRKMIADLDPRLGEVVAIDGEVRREVLNESIH